MHVAMSAILLSSAAGTLLAQSSSSSTSSPVQGNAASFGAPVSVARTTKAVNYRRASGSLKVELQGTELMPGASAEVKVENKNNRMEIELKFAGLEDTTKFGLEYLAYVLWAVSPQGRAENLGEVAAKKGPAKLQGRTHFAALRDVLSAGAVFRGHAAWQHGRSRKYASRQRSGGEHHRHLRIAWPWRLFLVQHEN